MPNSNPKTVSPYANLFAQYSLPQGTTRSFIQSKTGQTNVNFEFPDNDQEKAVVALATALVAYDNDPSAINLANFNKQLAQRGYSAVKIPENPNILFFFPKRLASQLAFMWNFGAIKTLDNPDAAILNCCVLSGHEGGDGAFWPAFKKGLLCKFTLFNTISRNADRGPSPYQHSRHASDMCHSETLAIPFLGYLLKSVYPTMKSVVNHGLSDINKNTGKRKEMQLWFINGRSFFRTSDKSFPALHAIAMALQGFKDGSVSVGSDLPGRLDDRPLTNPKNKNNPIFSRIPHPPATDVLVHLANHGNPRTKGQFIDYAVHMEHGGPYKEDSPQLAKEVAAFVQACYWDLHWDNRVHNFKLLPGEVLADMRQFPAWFDAQLLKAAALPKQDAAARIAAVGDTDDADELAIDAAEPLDFDSDLDEDDIFADQDDDQTDTASPATDSVKPMLLSGGPSATESTPWPIVATTTTASGNFTVRASDLTPA